MKILHLILGKADKNRANGVNQVIAGLAKYTAKKGVAVFVLGKAETAKYEGELIQRDGFAVTVYTKWSKTFREAVRQAVNAADVVHLHGVYSSLNIWAGWVCESSNKPYIITLHGGLSPGRNTWKNVLQKRLFHVLFQQRHLEEAALVQALTEEESTAALSYFRPRAMTVIPNGVDLEDFPPISARHQSSQIVRIGYIGRISREKNLDALCEAFRKINAEGQMQLLLAGPASSESDLIASRWASNGVVLVGPKFGSEKLEFLNSIDLFVHPSKTDVFSIAAMEALACGVPLVISRTSDISHFAEMRAFIMCEPTAFGIERALRKALARQAASSKMGRRGRHLIETRLNWDSVAIDMIKVYDDIRNSRPFL